LRESEAFRYQSRATRSTRRTRVYAEFAHPTEDDDGACGSGLSTYCGSHAGSSGGRDNGSGFGKTGVNVGIRHSF